MKVFGIISLFFFPFSFSLLCFFVLFFERRLFSKLIFES